jgi:bifunctional DNA primase/polymerase-like protein/uncharacterized protein DUF3987
MEHPSQLEVARSYLQRGWMPIPIPHQSKNPNRSGWQHFSVKKEDLPQFFNGKPQNVGVLLGKPSSGLTDIDLDCAESIALASFFLPSSHTVFGRISKPRSHYLYIVTGDESKTAKFEDKDGKMLLELRSTGCQTIFPGSTHPSGEKIEWDSDGEPLHVSYAELSRVARRIAAACLIVRHYPVKGSRNNLALALAGGLLRAGWSEQETEHFINAICTVAQDEETRARAQSVISTAKKLATGEKATGWPTLAKIIEPRVVDKVREWLGINYQEAQEPLAEPPPIAAWPKLHPAALYGIAGDFVRQVEPHSEADPVALLVQFLIGVGNLIGRAAHFIAEADRHYTNIFAVLVGDTGTGRKGTSWGQVKRVLESLDESWARDCLSGGLSSGEGLIYNVRDAVVSIKPIKAGGEAVGVDGHVIADKGVTDKRLLVFEGEFASVLRAQGREGNTLSMVIRNLWDTGNARSMVKTAPTRTTGAHVSIVGHITKQELRNCLDDVESVNGYVNRFLWVCTRRSKFLPRGGRLSSEDFAPVIRHLRACIDHSRTVGEMTFDDVAGAMWDEVYIGLETGRTGLLGKVTQRASPYVLRLSCLYALLDCSATVKCEHLAAALSLWKYCEDSARYIFGERTGDRLADNLLRALREAETDGLTRTDISNMSGRNISAARISSALASLAEAGLAYFRREQVEGSKRPIERWFAGIQQAANSYEVDEINEVNADAAD